MSTYREQSQAYYSHGKSTRKMADGTTRVYLREAYRCYTKLNHPNGCAGPSSYSADLIHHLSAGPLPAKGRNKKGRAFSTRERKKRSINGKFDNIDCAERINMSKGVNSVATEEEKRIHRCCFTGHRPEKLSEDSEAIKDWLTQQINAAITAGYTTFITGCAMGVDIWAAQIVIHIREEQKSKRGKSNLHLIAATPWPGFSTKWNIDWQQQYSDLLKSADLIVPVCNRYHKGVLQQRNEWMVDHSNRVIAYYNGAPGSTRDTVEYAQKKQIEVITNNPEFVETPKMTKERKARSKADKLPYPENLITDLGLEAICGSNEYKPLNDDQIKGLQYALQQLRPREQEVLKARYENQGTLQVVGEQFGFTRERARQIILKALRKLRNPLRLDFVRDGYEA